MKHTYEIGTKFSTNRDGEVVLLSMKGSVATVRFVNTGYEREVNISNLVKGKCKDYTIACRKYTEAIYPYELMSSNNYGDFILIEKDGKNCVVQFITTGHTMKCLWENIKNGKIQDPYYASAYGIGYLGEYSKPFYWKQAHQLWRNMLKRCYSENDPKGYFGKGVTVCNRWLCFANFVEDIAKLENFDLWVEAYKGNAIKYNLDKDFLYKGNKVYSPETCMFLDESTNKRLGGMWSKNGQQVTSVV